ncbi:Mu-like prophage major head subunit gpT [Methyloligella halotolerans]|uniref:Mu-like prophage major head subunit gpT n=1 Tax=Methyloligella halotolerans TaxID=1177755 RepID=A0A1E2RYB8_9HYPH|nr:prohead protease/major capsid protein fusion protein [Methyloligella halotolerans]ODA67105.1 Mu-like prophage major head subunit gpT [Methyloligella halotolerans]
MDTNLLTRSETVDLFKRLAEAPRASSWNAESRTVEVIFSTGAPVERYDSRGAFTEVLDVAGFEGAEGAPVLDHHRRDSFEAMLGSVVSARAIGGKAHATLKLSPHNPVADRIANELADGTRLGVSVGYTVEDWKERTDRKSGRREKIATRWTVREVSLVLVPADRQATTRGESMTVKPAQAKEPEAPVNTPENTVTAPEKEETPAAERAAVNVEIRSIAKITGLDQGWIDKQIDSEASVEEARAAAFEAMKTRAEPTTQIRNTAAEVVTDHTDPEARALVIGEALYARANPGHEISERARGYAHMSTLDVARDCLSTRGISVAGLAPTKLIERALHTTSDFPLILGDAVNRTLRKGYQAAPSGLKRAGRKTTAKDFREKHRLALSAGDGLEKVNEAGEFKSGSLAEAGETYRLLTFGRIFSISRQALVNDDIGAFTDLSRRLGQTAAASEANFLVDLLTENAGLGPTMSDNKKLFHADHGNLANPGTALSVASLSAARTGLRKQTGLKGEAISVTPKYLVVPPELETDAEKLLAQITAAKAEDINPFSGSLELVVEPRLSDGLRWYVAASPAEIDGLEYAYLEGEEGPQIETKAGFEVDGVQIKVRLDFGAGMVEWRSWYANPGSAE